MSDSAVATPPAAKRTAPRIGSFTLGSRVVDPGQRLGNVALVAGTGSEGTAHAGVPGFAYCTPLGELTAEQAQQAAAILARIGTLNAPTLVPILEAGLTGRVAYVTEAAVPGERLSDTLARERRLPPWRVASIVGDVGAALQVAHAQRIGHGMLVPMVIWVDGDRGAKLGGFGLAGRGPGRDREQLAALSFELLSGQPWDAAGSQSGGALVDRVRDQVPGLTERVASVVARGLDPDPASSYQSAPEFANAFREAVAGAATDVAAGAWEAISRGDTAMAAILTEMTVAYDPQSPELSLLRLRLDKQAMAHGSLASIPFAEPAAAPVPRLEPPATAPAPAIEESATPASVQLDEAELRRLFMPPADERKKPKGNPWVIFLSVIFGMIVLLTILAALAFNQS